MRPRNAFGCWPEAEPRDDRVKFSMPHSVWTVFRRDHPAVAGGAGAGMDRSCEM